ncbi:hypothetical protein [Algoriphagus sp.]|uniref:hypothetical protein n=1 Tax=Algoriphagus sp. TaxID=1872435 RepID=UPI0025EEA313|nr:hypothetical protein [Algoriphagus sp.]
MEKKIFPNFQSLENDIPLTDFNAYVKFSRPSFLNPLGEMILREAFPAFSPDEKTYDSELWKKIEEANLKRHSKTVDGIIKENGLQYGLINPRVFRIKGSMRRRFAGDFYLSRGSYYSVCNDEYGNDNGTLKQELSSYLLPEINDQIVVHDLEMPRDEELLKQHVKAPTGFVIELLNSEEKINPIILKLHEAKLIPEIITKPMLVYMPLAVEYFTIPRVLDLRLLEAQNWLTQFLPKGNEILKMPKAKKLDSFCEMLPTLMYPDRGGNDITDSIGFLLRVMKVNGLVFPSARCNVLCEFLDGKLNNFKGWNFLDYRSSNEILGGFHSREDVSQWNKPEDFVEGAVCRLAPDDSPFAHSWKIEGLEENLKESLSQFLPAQTELIYGGVRGGNS